ncbi:MAG: EAL domain-containing protein [Pseudomonadota bacterium]
MAEPATRLNTQAADHSLTPTIQSEQIRLLFAQGRVAPQVTVAVGLGLGWLSWGVVPPAILFAWLALLIIVSVIRVQLVKAFDAATPDDEELHGWCIRFTRAATASGLSIGIAGVFAYYGGLEYQVIVTFVIGGMALGAIPLLSPEPKTYALYVIASCSPTLAALFASGQEARMLMGVMATVFCAALIVTGRIYNRSLVRGFQLAHENSALEAGLHSERQVSRTLRESETELRQNQARLRTFADLGADLFWESDHQMRFTYLSEGYEKLCGISPDKMLGHSMRTAGQPCLIPNGWLTLDGQAAKHEPFNEYSVVWKPPGSQETVMLSSGLPIIEAGEFRGYRGTVRDVTEQHRLSALLTFQATHDDLTKLLNRREFEERVGRAHKKSGATNAVHVLCYIDLDQFKVVNDTCGHAVGDRLLIQVADLLQHHLRRRDTIARLGGDEFALLLEHCTLEDGLPIIKNLHRAIGAHRFQWDDNVFNMSVSVGVTQIGAQSQSVQRCMLAADNACYEAKRLGRNRIIVDDENSISQSKLEEANWVGRINAALSDDGFSLLRQRIAPLGSSRGRRERWELLLRMRDADGTLISPDSFLPAAEKYNLIGKIDAWVVETALQWLDTSAKRASNDLHCSINLSGFSLMDEQFLTYISDRIQRSKVEGQSICFEITETAAITNFNAAKHFIDRLSRLGCQFALDDFGAGLSSFGYLKHLPVSYLKIDGQFVRDITHDPNGEAVVRSMNELGHIMGKQTSTYFGQINEDILSVCR